MSFDTRIEIANLGDTALSLSEISDRVLGLLDRDGVHRHFFSDLCTSFESGGSTCNVHPAYVRQILTELSPFLPNAHFAIRCLGEEFRHTWICEISGGKVSFEAGPWDYE